MTSRYVMHTGRSGYGVRETRTDLLVWQAADASATSAAYLITFLNSHALHLSAAQVRAALVPFGSDLSAVAEQSDDPAESGERAS